MIKKEQKKRTKNKPSSSLPAKITLLYESRDGRFCLFEDAHGHLTAVRSAFLV